MHGIRDGVQAHELWEGKFEFRSEMLPGFLEEAFGRKASTKLAREGSEADIRVSRSSRLASLSTS